MAVRICPWKERPALPPAVNFRGIACIENWNRYFVNVNIKEREWEWKVNIALPHQSANHSTCWALADSQTCDFWGSWVSHSFTAGLKCLYPAVVLLGNMAVANFLPLLSYVRLSFAFSMIVWLKTCIPNHMACYAVKHCIICDSSGSSVSCRSRILWRLAAVKHWHFCSARHWSELLQLDLLKHEYSTVWVCQSLVHIPE